jgi:hypothetical protein
MDSFQAFLEKNKFKYNIITNDNKKNNKNEIINNQPIKTDKSINKCKKIEEEFYKCYDKKGFEKCINIYNKYIFCDIKK